MTECDLAKSLYCGHLQRSSTVTKITGEPEESILSRLRQRLSEAEEMPPKKRSSKWAGNSNAKRKARQIKVGFNGF